MEFLRWKEGIRKIADNKNVYCKLSGITMTDHSWSLESIKVIFDFIIESFGLERCIVASNFPVDKLFGSYDQIYNSYRKILENYSDGENKKLFSSTANMIYKIN